MGFCCGAPGLPGGWSLGSLNALGKLVGHKMLSSKFSIGAVKILCGGPCTHDACGFQSNIFVRQVGGSIISHWFIAVLQHHGYKNHCGCDEDEYKQPYRQLSAAHRTPFSSRSGSGSVAWS